MLRSSACSLKGATFTSGDSAVIDGETNLEHLSDEWSQLVAMMMMLVNEDIIINYSAVAALAKMEKVREYARYSQQLGVIDKDARIS